MRFFYYNLADVKDYKKFPSLPVHNSNSSFHFAENPKLRMNDSLLYNGTMVHFEEFLKKNQTLAFLLIRNDTILFEKYFDHYDASSVVPSFSMAKSFTSALVGIAIQENYIKSVDQPITDFFPEIQQEDCKKITIAHLLNMRSGIQYTENYFNPFGNVAKYYYGTNINQYIKQCKTHFPPDETFEYISMNSQLLGMIVERATGKKLSAYLTEKIWQPLQMEYDATWSVDSKKNQVTKAFCCLNARARDYAKFGRLYLNNGKWNGRQIVPEDWVRSSTCITPASKQFHYSYQWWHTVNYETLSDTTKFNQDETYSVFEKKDKNGNVFIRYKAVHNHDFYAQGFMGQFIYVYPSKHIIIVRLGKNYGINDWPKVFLDMSKEL